jgi:polar amino acid transport system permease protein
VRALGESDLAVLLLMRASIGRAAPDPSGALLTARSGATIGLLLLATTVFAETIAGATRPDLVTVLLKWAPLIFSGFLFNLLVSVLTMAIGTCAGIALGLAQVAAVRTLRRTAWCVTQFFRNAPWLVLLFYAMFLLPFELRLGAAVLPFPAWVKAVIGLALPVMANVSEIVRGGVRSIPVGQWEAAESLAFSRAQTLWRIILPQAIRRMIAPWMNLYAILTMATTLISVVGIQDGMTLTRAALVAEGRVDLFIPLYLMLLLMFFAYCYPIARWTAVIEQRLGAAS